LIWFGDIKSNPLLKYISIDVFTPFRGKFLHVTPRLANVCLVSSQLPSVSILCGVIIDHQQHLSSRSILPSRISRGQRPLLRRHDRNFAITANFNRPIRQGRHPPYRCQHANALRDPKQLLLTER
jgi:hypothetical protein